jgi:alpha-galactosidase/6-phospho-beta-glucosidase family protein
VAALVARSPRPWAGFANVANRDLVTELAPGLIVETRAHLADGDIRPEPLRDPVPSAVRRFLDRVGRAEDLLYRACVEDDDDGLVDALIEGPHLLDQPTAESLVDDIRADVGHPLRVAG